MNSDYADLVGVALTNLQIDQVFVVAEKVRPENTEKFVSIVKSYIQKGFGNEEKWQIEFNKEFSRIRKTYYNL